MILVRLSHLRLTKTIQEATPRTTLGRSRSGGKPRENMPWLPQWKGAGTQTGGFQTLDAGLEGEQRPRRGAEASLACRPVLSGDTASPLAPVHSPWTQRTLAPEPGELNWAGWELELAGTVCHQPRKKHSWWSALLVAERPRF